MEVLSKPGGWGGGVDDRKRQKGVEGGSKNDRRKSCGSGSIEGASTFHHPLWQQQMQRL
jgi:hypothetical protein